MVICSICNQKIKSTDDAAILSYPIKIDNNGIFSFSELMRNKFAQHLCCLNLDKVCKAKNKNITEDKWRKFNKALKDINEISDETKIERFLAKYDYLDNIDQLLNKWFQIK